MDRRRDGCAVVGCYIIVSGILTFIISLVITIILHIQSQPVADSLACVVVAYCAINVGAVLLYLRAALDVFKIRGRE